MAGILQTAKNTAAENLGGVAQSLAPEEHQFTRDDVPDLSGKVAVVTGGSDGIGFAAAYTMMEHGLSKLFILSSSEGKAKACIEDMEKNLKGDVKSKVTWLPIDLADWEQVTQVADQISAKTDRLDILINNAGRGIMTQDMDSHGVDRHMSVNHFGHATLTGHLLPLMQETTKRLGPNEYVRISCQSSNLHSGIKDEHCFDDMEHLNKDYGPEQQYGRSKLANLLYARWLAKEVGGKYPKLLVNSTHPGVVETKMSTEDIYEPHPVMGVMMDKVMKPVKKSIWDGCLTSLYCATKTTKTGQYICPPAIPETGDTLADTRDGKTTDALEKKLMALTDRVVLQRTTDKESIKQCPISKESSAS